MAYRREVIAPKVREHRGRIVKHTGDGALVEFGSVEAVRCALDVQRIILARNAGLPQDRRIDLRIGVNLGDVIVAPDDIYGHGVNIAEGFSRNPDYNSGNQDGFGYYQATQKTAGVGQRPAHFSIQRANAPTCVLKRRLSRHASYSTVSGPSGSPTCSAARHGKRVAGAKQSSPPVR